MKTIFLTLMLIGSQAFAHGEDAPGPNGGHIRMPGAFHTEVLYDVKTQDLHVYLLDINFQNPTIQNSSVGATFKSGKEKISYHCASMDGNHFHCVPGKKVNPKGELIIQATRENAVGNEAIYKFPLKEFSNKKKSHQHAH